MSYIYYNPNPAGKRVGDCVVRAICRLFVLDWETAFMLLSLKAFEMHDMPSANSVWGELLREHGFKRRMLEDTCPACYTVSQFSEEHQIGRYLLATGTHVIAMIDGIYYDTWDSGDEVPAYYWAGEEE